MSKFYFTHGTDPRFPYRLGWTEVEAPNMEFAIELFKYYHPNRPGSGCLNCAFYYTAEQFEVEDNIMLSGNFGDKCHERITLTREVLEESNGNNE